MIFRKRKPSMLNIQSTSFRAFSFTACLLATIQWAQAMPQDSTAYYRIAWSISGGSSKNVNLVGLGAATATSIFSFNTTVFSNGSPVRVDPLIRPSGHFTTNYRDRGGAEYVSSSLQLTLTPNWMWGGPRDHGTGTPGQGLFRTQNYSGTTSPRGWIKVDYNPGSVSAANLSQPFAVRTSVIPIGNHPEQWLYDQKHGGLGYSPATRIPLAEMGISFNRVLFLQAMHMNDGGDILRTFNQAPMSSGGVGSAFSVQGTDFVFDINGGPTHSGSDFNVNRGYINVDHIAAECGDGLGTLNTATNVGGRQVTAHTWNGTDYASVSNYQGCHGHSNGTYVIENTGDDIWNNSDRFRFAHKGYNGNRNFICRVDQLENTGSWARSGIMIRTGTGVGDVNAAVFVTPGNGIVFQYRGTANQGTSQVASVSGIRAPIWLRLEYNGGTTRAYRSTNGTSWTQIGNGYTKTFSNYQAGLAAAGRSSVPNTSVYSNLQNF